MRIRALPPTVTARLGVKTLKAAAPYLKYVQRLYCDRLSNNQLCPAKCWRCAPRLEAMAAAMPQAVIGSDAQVGFWHTAVRSYVIELLEALHGEPEPVRGDGEVRSAAQVAGQLRRMLEE